MPGSNDVFVAVNVVVRATRRYHHSRFRKKAFTDNRENVVYPLAVLILLSALVPYRTTAQSAVERWRIPVVLPWTPSRYHIPIYIPEKSRIVYGIPPYSDDIVYVDVEGIRSTVGSVVDYRHLEHEDGSYALFVDGRVGYIDDMTAAVRFLRRITAGAELLGVDEALHTVLCRKDSMLYLVRDDGEPQVKEIQLFGQGDGQIVLVDGGATVMHMQGFANHTARIIKYDVESGLVTSNEEVPLARTAEMISKRTMHVGEGRYLDLTNGRFFSRNGEIASRFVMDTVHVVSMLSPGDTLVLSVSIDTARGSGTVFRFPLRGHGFAEIYPKHGSVHVVAHERYWVIDVANKAVVDSGRNDVPFTFVQEPFALSRNGSLGLYMEHSFERGDKFFVVDRIKRRVLDSIRGGFMPRSKAFHVEGDSIVAWYETGAARMSRRSLWNDRAIRRFGKDNLRFFNYLGDGRSLCFVDSMGTYAIVPAGGGPVHCPPLTAFGAAWELDVPVMFDQEGGQLHLTAKGYMNVDISTQGTSAHPLYKDLIASMYKEGWRFQIIGAGAGVDTLAAICPGCAEPHGSQFRIVGPNGIDSFQLDDPSMGMEIQDNRTLRAVVLVSNTRRVIAVVDGIGRKGYRVPMPGGMRAFRACEDGSGLMLEFALGDSLMLYDFRNGTVLWKDRRPSEARYTSPDASAVIIAERSRDTVRVMRYPRTGPSAEICEPIPLPDRARFAISGFGDAIVWHDRDTIHRIDIADRSIVSHRMEMPFANGEVPAISTDRHGRTVHLMHRGSVGQGAVRGESYIGALNFSDGKGYLIPSFVGGDLPLATDAVPEPIFYDRNVESIMLGEDGRIMGCFPSYVMAQLENGNLLCGGWVGMPMVGMMEYTVGTLSWSGQKYPKRLVDVTDYGGIPVAISRKRAAIIAINDMSSGTRYYYKTSADAEALFLGTECMGASPSLDYVFARRDDSVFCYRTRDGAVLYGCPFDAFGTVKQWVGERSVIIARHTDVRLLDLDPDATSVADEAGPEGHADGAVMRERAFDLLGREVDIDARGPKIIVGVDASGRRHARKTYRP